MGVRGGVAFALTCLLAGSLAAAEPASSFPDYSMGTGVIGGYPSIMPQPLGPNNYLQAIYAMQLPDGSIALLGNTGHCCYSAREAWEGGFALWYRAFGDQPVWMPIYGTNDYGREWKGEHELAFPAAGFMCDRWVVSSIGTLESTWGMSNRARLYVLEMDDLVSGRVTVPWRLWKCGLAGCDPFPVQAGSSQCAGTGFGNSLVRFRGRWYVYVSDDCAPIPGYYRYEITNPCTLELGPPELITWTGSAPGSIGDFALGWDGWIHALSDLSTHDGVEEWASADGLRFERNGREVRFGSDLGANWDGSWLKTPTGAMVAPETIFMTTAPVWNLWSFAPENPWSIRWITRSPSAFPAGWWIQPNPFSTLPPIETRPVRRHLTKGE